MPSCVRTRRAQHFHPGRPCELNAHLVFRACVKSEAKLQSQFSMGLQCSSITHGSDFLGSSSQRP